MRDINVLLCTFIVLSSDSKYCLHCMYILLTIKRFRVSLSNTKLNVARKFYFVTVFSVFLLQIRCFFYNCQKHLNNKTHSHRNSFRVNLCSPVSIEIVMKIDQLEMTNCKKDILFGLQCFHFQRCQFPLRLDSTIHYHCGNFSLRILLLIVSFYRFILKILWIFTAI